MTPKVVLYKGNNDINALYTGKVGELTYNTNLNTVHVHDGTTTGGIKLVTLNPNNTIVSTNLVISSTITTNNMNSINITTNTFTTNSANVNSFTAIAINANSANINSFTAIAINANSANVNSFIANTVSANSVSGNTANFTSVTVNNAPTSNTQLANKLYVDKKLRLAIAISGV